MTVKTVTVAPGMELDIEEFTKAENDIFDRDYEKVTAYYTRFSIDKDSKHYLLDAFKEAKDVFRLIGQACKKSIEPSAGVFQGQRALTGFGFRIPRPDDLLPAAQGRTFDAIYAGGINTWNGLYHNGAIGAAYNAAPLYLRKELGIGIIGLLELDASPKVEEVQFELNGKPLPVYNMLHQMRGTDTQFFRFPSVEYLKPAIQYRSQAKYAALGTVCLVPVGLTFVTSDYMRNAAAQTLPTINAP